MATANKPANISTHYPAISLDYAIKVVEKARVLGKSISDTTIAGGGSTKSGAFTRKRAALGYFGLISGRGENLQITELAEKIISPLNENEKTSAIKESFLKPALYRKLYDTVEKEVSIEVSMLGNLVVREFGIQPSGKDDFMNTFISSGQFAQLINYIDGSKDRVEFRSIQDDLESSGGSDMEESTTQNGGFRVSTSGMIDLEISGIRLFIPKNEKTQDAIAAGELKELRNKIIEFSKKYLSEQSS